MKNLITLLFLTTCLSTFAQQPIFATTGGGDLYSLNVSNCTSRFVGSTNWGFGDIAFTPNGKLWGTIGGTIYQIDTSNANTTLLGYTQAAGVSLVALNDSILLTEYYQKLYSINLNTLNSVYIDSIGYQAAGDLTWYDNDLYLTTGTNQLVKIVLNSNNTGIVSVTPINTTSHQIPNCEGSATSPFVNDYNSIIGFSGQSAFKICQLDGSYQLLCYNILPNAIPGAASIRLPTQIPIPTSCTQVAGVELLSNFNAVKIYPQPANNKISIDANDVIDVKLFDILGKQITSTKLTDVDVSNLPEGVYFIQVHTKQSTTTQKIMVQH